MGKDTPEVIAEKIRSHTIEWVEESGILGDKYKLGLEIRVTDKDALNKFLQMTVEEFFSTSRFLEFGASEHLATRASKIISKNWNFTQRNPLQNEVSAEKKTMEEFIRFTGGSKEYLLKISGLGKLGVEPAFAMIRAAGLILDKE